MDNRTKDALIKRRIEEALASRVKKPAPSRKERTSLPLELFQRTNLTQLDLSQQRLTTLPPELFHHTNMTELNLSNNQLKTLPLEICQLTNLTKLNLSNNQLSRLPPEICQLTNLTELDLKNNPLNSPPPEIANRGIEAIRKYFARLEKSKYPLNEVKILLIGDGAAGKTSLVKRLFGQPFDKHEDTTHGISIQGWEQKVRKRQIKINIWDFGGQETQHATHQFFLSKRSLYVLVLDGRKDERTEYWLRHVEVFGGNSPVLIVLNKMDSSPGFDINRPFLQEKYPGIRGFFHTSCKTGEGIVLFRKALLRELNKVEMLKTIWPGTWFTVKSRLEQMNRPYISANEYGSLCQEAEIADEESRKTLVDFLHDLGVAVHFNDIDLKTMHVLDPVWVTEAVYKIITAQAMADSKGVLDLNALEKILKDQPAPRFGLLRTMLQLPCAKCYCFPSDTHLFILHLMEKFELCYPVDKEAVLIPQLLPVSEPRLGFSKDGAFQFALHYPDFLPPSVFPRFMVKVHKDIHENTCWRTGVLLKDKRSRAHALVKADVEARQINIWVRGERPREYLHYLRYLLADLNSSFKKLTVSERVPMPDNPYVSADYENLLDLADAGSDIFIPIGSKKHYSVHKLLGLVQPKDRDELVRVAEKATPQDTTTWIELFNELVEPEWTVPVIGIKLNLKGFFDKLLAIQKQK
ncbi:GTP-binding protein, partial [Desulfobulbus sp. US4]|nr:GTP-binding protein [Desulfobulbus sp. US4]